jgi:hypothetical protein
VHLLLPQLLQRARRGRHGVELRRRRALEAHGLSQHLELRHDQRRRRRAAAAAAAQELRQPEERAQRAPRERELDQHHRGGGGVLLLLRRRRRRRGVAAAAAAGSLGEPAHEGGERGVDHRAGRLVEAERPEPPREAAGAAQHQLRGLPVVPKRVQQQLQAGLDPELLLAGARSDDLNGFDQRTGATSAKSQAKRARLQKVPIAAHAHLVLTARALRRQLPAPVLGALLHPAAARVTCSTRAGEPHTAHRTPHTAHRHLVSHRTPPLHTW